MKRWSCFLGACVVSLGIACAASKPPRVVLRDAKVYQAEIDFLGMALRQSQDLLEQHIRRNCGCDAQGQWSDSMCEETAKIILVIQKRLSYHIWMMEYNAGLRDEPLQELPDLGHPSELCPPAKEDTDVRL